MPNSNSYYQMKKHLYKARYEENKRKENENYELFKKYGGEKEYYKQQYIKSGFYKSQPPLIALALAADIPEPPPTALGLVLDKVEPVCLA